MVAVAFNHSRGDAFASKDVLKRPLDSAGASSRGTGDGNDRVEAGHQLRRMLGGVCQKAPPFVQPKALSNASPMA